MKRIKSIAALAIILSSAQAVFGAPIASHFQQFVTGYRSEVVDTQRNMIAPAWVHGAINALRADGTTNLQDPNVVTYLWRSIENVVKYYAELPANRNNRDFTTRIWQSLVRSVDEIARTQQPVAQQSPQNNQYNQQRSAGFNDQLISMGVTAFHTFRILTAQTIEKNPTYFYSAGSIQPSWLREALKHITANGQVSITAQNQATISGEIAGAAEELMRQVLRSDQRLSPAQKENVIKMVRGQVEQFVNSQTMRSRL